MKRVSIFAAALMFAFGAIADAQVYELSMTIKTTITKSGAIKAIVCDKPSPEVNLYRKQATVKIKGLFWGCDCETIANPTKIISATETYGYILWNETTHQVIDADFSWKVLNRIDDKLKKAEGAWMLEGDSICLIGGGFGNVKDDVSSSTCTIMSTILTPMSGNVAGWMGLPSVVVAKGKADDCYKCQVIEGSDEVVAFAPGWSLCTCIQTSSNVSNRCSASPQTPSPHDALGESPITMREHQDHAWGHHKPCH